MFTTCDFVMGQEGMVIVLPGNLPKDAPNFTISASEKDIKIRAGYNEIARFPYENSDVFNRLSGVTQVGIVEYPKDKPFPNCITALAYVELRMQ